MKKAWKSFCDCRKRVASHWLTLLAIQGTVGFLCGVGLAGVAGMEYMPKTSSELASWLQAMGAIFAIWVAFRLGADQARNARRAADREDAQENAAFVECGRLLGKIHWSFSRVMAINSTNTLHFEDESSAITGPTREATQIARELADIRTLLVGAQAHLFTRREAYDAVRDALAALDSVRKLLTSEAAIDAALVQNTVIHAVDKLTPAWQKFDTSTGDGN
ncbi:hypothetical protein A7P25_22025 [Achromobacter xylosoxidans]|nr:hypothetical protein A7P25_22025 [Achromobacter xylosoxidans]